MPISKGIVSVDLPGDRNAIRPRVDLITVSGLAATTIFIEGGMSLKWDAFSRLNELCDVSPP
jgi:hypothetical protein